MFPKRIGGSPISLILIDLCLFIVSYLVAYWIRFDFSISYIIREYSTQIPYMLCVVCVIKSLWFYSFGLYRRIWRYTSIADMWRVIEANVVSQISLIAFVGFVHHFINFPRAVFLLDGILSLLLTSGARLVTRSLYIVRDHPWGWRSLIFSSGKIDGKKVIVVGAGGAGEKVAREIQESQDRGYVLLGFVDDDKRKQGRMLLNFPVLGKIEDIPSIVDKYGIEEILIAIPSATGEEMRRIVSLCKKAGVSFKTLPGLKEIIDGRVSINDFREVSFEDLLGRRPVRLYSRDIERCLSNRNVVITGAGGSIGSELCRQILKFQPSCLILIDNSESNLYSIEMELKNEFGFLDYIPVLGGVQDRRLMERVFETYSPEVVFHAAAYKHVPMLELNPWQAVHNNIIGTRTIMEVSVNYRVKRFVLVSTDKAVRPTNVMGASKRVGELLMFVFNGGETKIMAVRFGNVVGSSGSVIPLFKRQIQMGGPVTVTHPEVVRYFMTISEAAQLILQAGSMGEGGEIFILDMGTPVKIVDMARDLIRLSGKEPNRDIDIVFTGLRPGEKLYEELITQGEGIVATRHEKILVLRDKTYKDTCKFREWLDANLMQLEKLSARFDAQGIKNSLSTIVPEYTPKDSPGILSLK